MPGDPPAALAENAGGSSPYVLLCEHAANYIPPKYDRLGLDETALRRHIAWDIGAAPLARLLSRGLDAPLFLSGYSRLLIDCNRPLGTATSIPERSEDVMIPGNAGLSALERSRRAATYFVPFQTMVADELDRRTRLAIPTIVVGVHSFTPVFAGVARPWQAGVLFAAAAEFGRALVMQLAADPALIVGENQPYQIEPEHDHTVPVHGDGRGIAAALLEIRQDLLSSDDDVAAWSERLLPALAALAGHARAPGAVPCAQ